MGLGRREREQDGTVESVTQLYRVFNEAYMELSRQRKVVEMPN